MYKILIVDDEVEITNITGDFLIKHGFSVFKAYNGSEAIKVLKKQDMDLIISDMAMPGTDGIELVKILKSEINRSIPFVVMTGQINKKNIQEIISVGINALIEKPFQQKELLKIIEHIIKYPNEKLNDSFLEKDEAEFLGISIEDYFKNPVASYDTYIKLSVSKFLLILRKGDELSPDRVRNYIRRNVKLLYVKKSDHRKYFETILVDFNKGKSSRNIKEKSNQLRRINELIMEEIYSKNIDKEIFESSVEISKINTEIILMNDIMFDLLIGLEKYSDDVFRHSAGVNIVSIMISKKHGWVSEGVQLKIALAGLYHDVGKKWLDKKILKTQFSNYSENDWHAFKKHPLNGGEILSGLSIVPEDVIRAVMEHHENYFGGGYPYNLNHFKIHPLAKVLAIANDYCNLTLKQEVNPTYKHDTAIEIMKEMKEKYDDDLFKTFMTLFN